MFRRVTGPRLALALALALALVLVLVCPPTAARAQTAPATTTTAPTTAPEPIVANPHYLAWAKYKPGTQVEFEMNLLAGGQQMTTHVTLTLAELTADRAVVESLARLSVPGVAQSQEHARTLTFNAQVPQSEAGRAMFPSGGQGETQNLGTEKIEAAGRAYETQLHAFTGTVQNAPATGKQWRSADVPGGLVKMESNAANAKVEMSLKKVTPK